MPNMVSFTTFFHMAAAMAFVAGAIPVEERQIGAKIATFDDFDTPSVVSLTSVGVYQGLNYSGICRSPI